MVTRRNDEQTVAGRHRMMRRADREVADPQQVEAIIATCKIVSLAYTDAEGITIVPLNFGYALTRNPIISPCISMVLRPDARWTLSRPRATRFL